MIIDSILFLVALSLIILGANYLVDGASSLARKMGLSDFLIGLTIVGMGTSAPELVVSMMAAYRGSADIALGNVLGSNIFNTLLILGVTALIRPITISKKVQRQDLPMNIFTVLLVIILAFFHIYLTKGEAQYTFGLIDGIIFLSVFITYLCYSYFKTNNDENQIDNNTKNIKLPVSIFMILASLVALVYGGKLFIDKAIILANYIGISEKFMAIIILAAGTSMPELAICIVSALKKKADLALGNIIGSNIFNILLILGSSALIQDLNFSNINIVDISVLLLSTVLVLVFTLISKRKISRLSAFILLVLDIFYFTWLYYNM